MTIPATTTPGTYFVRVASTWNPTLFATSSSFRVVPTPTAIPTPTATPRPTPTVTPTTLPTPTPAKAITNVQVSPTSVIAGGTYTLTWTATGLDLSPLSLSVSANNQVSYVEHNVSPHGSYSSQFSTTLAAGIYTLKLCAADSVTCGQTNVTVTTPLSPVKTIEPTPTPITSYNSSSLNLIANILRTMSDILSGLR